MSPQYGASYFADPYQQQGNQFFNPNMPGADFGVGLSSVMQGLGQQTMMNKQLAEARRQFDVKQALEQQKQAWEEKNTPGYQYSTVAEATQQYGGDPAEIYLKQYRPDIPPDEAKILAKKARDMVMMGGAKDFREAYDKILKTGPENQATIRATLGTGARPDWRTDLLNKLEAERQKGTYGPPDSAEAHDMMWKNFNDALTNRKNDLTTPPPPKLSPVHKVLLGSTVRNVVSVKDRINAQLQSTMAQAQGQKWFMKLDPKTAADPNTWSDENPLKAQAQARLKDLYTLDAVIGVLQDLADETKGGFQMTPELADIIKKINQNPEYVLTPKFYDDLLAAMPEQVPGIATPPMTHPSQMVGGQTGPAGAATIK